MSNDEDELSQSGSESTSEKSKEGESEDESSDKDKDVEIKEEEDEGKGDDEELDDDEDLSWSSSCGESAEEIVLSNVTAEITPAQRFRRLFGLPATDEEAAAVGVSAEPKGPGPAGGGGPDGSMYIFDYIFTAKPQPGDAPDKGPKPAANKESSTKDEDKGGKKGCCIIS